MQTVNVLINKTCSSVWQLFLCVRLHVCGACAVGRPSPRVSLQSVCQGPQRKRKMTTSRASGEISRSTRYHFLISCFLFIVAPNCRPRKIKRLWPLTAAEQKRILRRMPYCSVPRHTSSHDRCNRRPLASVKSVVVVDRSAACDRSGYLDAVHHI